MAIANPSQSFINTFANKPGGQLPACVMKKNVTVEEDVNGKHLVDQFVQTGPKAVNVKTGATLSMTPTVAGGLKPGDIVLCADSQLCMAESGLVESLLGYFKSGKWQTEKATVSHAGIVVQDKDGSMKVVQMIGNESPPELDSKLTSWQKKIGAVFLRKDSIEQFFNDGAPTARGVVMRPKDQAAAQKAAQKAEATYESQITPSGARPWYKLVPHGLAPAGRGGVCSTFVDEMYDEKFHNGDHLPTTPQHYVDDTADLVKVGDRRMTSVTAAS